MMKINIKSLCFHNSLNRKCLLTSVKQFHSSSSSPKYIKTDLLPAYIPSQVENFEPKGYFEPKILPSPPFTLILPPPNVTGTLHLGHALTATIEDVLIRWNRMQGIETVWVPGMDHAGIATQVIVEKKLWKERGITRFELGRENFEKEILKWKNVKADIIKQELFRLGVSLDWSKEIFTLDEKQSIAVKTAFIQLFEENLIYRADHLINWCCILQSAISDIEVEHIQINGPTMVNIPGYKNPIEFGVLTKIAYKFCDSDDEIIVATTRPETILGDVAVAVHPKDDRYSKFIGKNLRHPFRLDEIPIIADEAVDPNFGTGAVKITPAHDPVDFEIGLRHGLPILQIIDEKGNLKEICERLSGIPRFQARDVILKDLKALNLLRGRQDHNMILPICSRSKDIIEFLVKPQWFVRCREMADKAIEIVQKKQMEIEPSHFQKNWFSWLENIRDWCISRQLWWGHRIPAFLCYSLENPDKKVWVAAENNHMAVLKAAKKLSTEIDKIIVNQDEDVLDTWFSSSLLPFSAFGWPEKTNELQKYYPLSIMETGHDILFFWVARMVMLGTQLTGKLPFSKVLLHGIICDANGKKMSKSAGNIIAPEDIISGASLQDLEHSSKKSLEIGIINESEFNRALENQKKLFPEGIPACGIDSLRFTLCSHNIKGHFINFDVNECYVNRLFCNKLWQATKFTKTWALEICKSQNVDLKTSPNLMDKWILSRLTFMVDSVNRSIKKHDFHIATTSIKNFLYYEFCDIYLESTKKQLQSRSVEAFSHAVTLTKCLDVSFRILAPFMPHLSQLLHQHLPLEVVDIPRNTTYPRDMEERNTEIEQEVIIVMDTIVAIRRMKKLFNISRKNDSEVRIITKLPLFSKYVDVIKSLSSSETINLFEESASNRNNVIVDSVGKAATIEISLPQERRNSLDFDVQKLEKKRTKLIKELNKMEAMVSAESYKVKAPTKAQQMHSRKISDLYDELARLKYVQNFTNKM